MKHTEWTTAISTPRTDYEFLRELKSCRIDGIELSVAEWEINNIDWDGLLENSKRANIALLSYHLPFGEISDISAIDEKLRESACKKQMSLMKRASGIGISRFVIHPSYEPIAEIERESRLENAKMSLALLGDYASSQGGTLCVENLPRTCLGHDVKEMLSLVSADENLRVCFDVNHLLYEFKDTHKDFVDALGDRIVTAHFSDYDFVDEKHYFCGNGCINWDELIGLLESVGYNGPFLYEGGFTPHRIFKDVPCGKFSEARSRQMNIRSFKGKNH